MTPAARAAFTDFQSKRRAEQHLSRPVDIVGTHRSTASESTRETISDTGGIRAGIGVGGRGLSTAFLTSPAQQLQDVKPLVPLEGWKSAPFSSIGPQIENPQKRILDREDP